MDLPSLIFLGAQIISSVTVGNSTPAAAPPVEMHTTELQLVECTNAERVRHGLSPLVLDPGLLQSARRHAAWMTRNRVLRHTSAAVAENIAMGQPTTAHAIQDWMHSPGHRANILNRSYTRIGVAGYRAPNGTVYWCQQFLR
ncbi:MAG: CAP domain-containing protein [Planctomycetota bacterium]|nr:CAP domain-containing protein [Planctomycetota bacterium]MDA1177705.1 CAP domain-containing protein [Planctomycetota bacterium]